MRLEHAYTQCQALKNDDLKDHLVDGVAEGQYDHRVAELLAAASAWSYADLRTYTDKLCQRGLDGETVKLAVRNDALLVDATAYLFQSADKKLAILSLRGTMQDNIIQWLTDTRARTVPFPTEGSVHGGLYRSGLALWPTLREFMAALYTGKSIGKRLNELAPKKPGKRPPSEVDAIGKKKPELEALYITGHSTGGSLAGLAAAGMYTDPKLEELRKLVRGVYAYGPAMFADPTLARSLQEKFGDKLFRFMYENDFVTQMPPMTVGRFSHFGRQYVSSSRDGVWVRERRVDREVMTKVAANVIGAMATIKESMLLARSMPMAFTWGDHAPLNYLRISQNGYCGLMNP